MPPLRSIPELSSPGPALENQGRAETTTPWYMRWMIQDTKRGMLVEIPYRLRPQPGHDHRVHAHLDQRSQYGDPDHARAVHHLQQGLRPGPDLPVLLLPDTVSTLHHARGRVQADRREALAMYEDEGSSADIRFFSKLQYNIDGGRRFYGIGEHPEKRVQIYSPAPLTTRPGSTRARPTT